MRADPFSSVHLLFMIYPVVSGYEEPSWVRTFLKAANVGSKVSENMFSVEVRTCYSIFPDRERNTYFQVSLFCINRESRMI